MHKAIRVSSSIANFREKIYYKYRARKRWSVFTLNAPTIFFGMYHIGDYLRLALHRGMRIVFWCGGDIKNLERRPFWNWFIGGLDCVHVCENNLEEFNLMQMGIYAEVVPMFFDVCPDVSFKPSETPHVYMTVHEGRESEYGLDVVYRIHEKVPEVTFHIFGIEGNSHDNILYHGSVSNEEFNNKIEEYQAALRLNEFDGFSEILGKSILMGQYPISRIKYDHMDSFEDELHLISLLHNLKHKIVPNPNRDYWYDKLCLTTL